MTARPLYTKSENLGLSKTERLPTGKMKLYTTTGTVKLRERCNDLDVGLMMVNHWRNPEQWSYFAIDNGCYSAFAQKKQWTPKEFLNILYKCRMLGLIPDFVIIPDIVAGGKESLRKSEIWGEMLNYEFPEYPLYLAVQDGITIEDVDQSPVTELIDGIFVGGSMDWKIEHIAYWVGYAHTHGLRCHIGRIGTLDRMMKAKLEGADSIDSTSWVQNKGWMETRVAAYRELEEESS